jgi:hypothetical protein
MVARNIQRIEINIHEEGLFVKLVIYKERRWKKVIDKQKEGGEGTDLGKGEGMILKNILQGSVCVCVPACVCTDS